MYLAVQLIYFMRVVCKSEFYYLFISYNYCDSDKTYTCAQRSW
jgi:hypothetical protein